MNVINTLRDELQRLLTGNTLYQDHIRHWQYLLESYLGGREYREAGHLTRYQLETDAEYQARLRSTPLENHCNSVVQVYNSFLFRKSPERTLDGLELLPELEDFLYDADLDGRSLDSFMKDVSTWASVFGHCWVIVSKPNVGAVTVADEQAEGVRPYVSMLTPMVVLDWDYQRAPSGRVELNYLRYIEDVTGDLTTVKVWTKESILTRVIDSGKNAVSSEYEEVNQLGIVPAVCVYNGRSVIRGFGTSDINDIADLQRFIYNATSEVEQSIRINTHPSLVKTPETLSGIGAGSIIHMPENLDPGLKPFLLEFTGASVDSIYSAINHAARSIDKLANIGSVRATESRTLSGVAMETEFQLLNARLSEKSGNLELAEEHIWNLWARYMGTDWQGTITYPVNFNIRDSEMEIAQLKIARETATDPRVFTAIDREIVVWMGQDPEEVLATSPEVIRTYENGEPIDPRLPEGYRDAPGQSAQCQNCSFYNSETGACSAFAGAQVRPQWVCNIWQAQD